MKLRTFHTSLFGVLLLAMVVAVSLAPPAEASTVAHAARAAEAQTPATPAEPSLALLAERFSQPEPLGTSSDVSPMPDTARAQGEASAAAPPRSRPGAGGLLGLLGSVLAFAGLGTVINLRTTDGHGRPKRVQLDSEADDFSARLDDHLEDVRDEARRPLQTDLSAAEADRDAYRDAMIDEILRVETLAHTGKDGTVSADFKADDEREFYESLTPKKLALHFKKAREKTVDLTPQTSGAEPALEDDAFGHVTVN